MRIFATNRSGKASFSEFAQIRNPLAGMFRDSRHRLGRGG